MVEDDPWGLSKEEEDFDCIQLSIWNMHPLWQQFHLVCVKLQEPLFGHHRSLKVASKLASHNPQDLKKKKNIGYDVH